MKVSTVGGIVTGFRGAIGVSESIMNGGESRELRSLRRELDLHLLIRKTIHQFKQADYSRLVDLMNDSTRRSLSQYTRDEASRVLWNIALEPAAAAPAGASWTALRRVHPSQKSRLNFFYAWTHAPSASKLHGIRVLVALATLGWAPLLSAAKKPHSQEWLCYLAR